MSGRNARLGVNAQLSFSSRLVRPEGSRVAENDAPGVSIRGPLFMDKIKSAILEVESNTLAETCQAWAQDFSRKVRAQSTGQVGRSHHGVRRTNVVQQRYSGAFSANDPSCCVLGRAQKLQTLQLERRTRSCVSRLSFHGDISKSPGRDLSHLPTECSAAFRMSIGLGGSMDGQRAWHEL